jgi:hypothetical protein
MVRLFPTGELQPGRLCRDELDLRALLHPASAYAAPANVLRDGDLTVAEKRAILSSWASDACAVESIPSLRATPGANPVTFDDIMDALKALDAESDGQLVKRAAKKGSDGCSPPWFDWRRKSRKRGGGSGELAT